MNLDDIFKKISAEKKASATGAPVWIIAGLGNIGEGYEYTRHNAGFLCIDTLAEDLCVKFDKERFNAYTAEAVIDGQKCLLMKPTTLMNRSGISIGEVSRFYKIPPENIIIIFDDINLDVGRIRIRRKGSDGGHNGIKSIISDIGSSEFPRVKVGVGQKPHPDFDLASWVLSKFFDSEKENLNTARKNACEAVKLIVSSQITEAMNRFNRTN